MICKRKFFFIPFVLFVLIVTVISIFIDKGDAVLFFSRYRTSLLNQFFIFCSFIVEGHMFALIGLVFFLKDYRKTIFVGLSGLFTLVFAAAFKFLFSMPRPLVYFNELGMGDQLQLIEDYVVSVNQQSFPSGHTASAFALALLLSVLIENKMIDLILVFVAIFAGISRVYLMNHFLMDIAAGAVLGVCVTILARWVTTKMNLPHRSFLRQKRA